MKKYSIPTFEYCNKSNMSSLHGSIIYSGKTPIVQTRNELRNSIFQKQLPSSHAEMLAIYIARYSLKKIRNPVLIVVRYNKKGELVDSYPCNLCIELIKQSGIHAVIYSDINGALIECKAKNLKHKHISKACKRCGIISW